MSSPPQHVATDTCRAAFFEALVTGKIENIIPQFPATRPAATAVIIRQTMPETEMNEIPAARFQIEDAISYFVENSK